MIVTELRTQLLAEATVRHGWVRIDDWFGLLVQVIVAAAMIGVFYLAVSLYLDRRKGPPTDPRD